MKKILIVFGTRPEAIKMAPLVLKMQEHKHTFKTKVCITAQHREMLDQVLDIFKIVPHFDLNLMAPGQDLTEISSKILFGMREVLTNYKPDLVLVHGDTTTSSMAALAAFYQQIPVGHVEAGLRTGNIYSPWPEEMNRMLTARIATWHFAPTVKAKENLITENVNENNIIVTGNTVIDALHYAKNLIDSDPGLQNQINKNLLVAGLNVSDIESDKKIILVTGHRRENFGQGFENICYAIQQFASLNPDINIIYPVHLNPNVQKPVRELLSKNKNIYLISPLDYLSFLYLMDKSYVILTDSGGIQEEAPGLGKPVLVMRDTTERPEAVEAGTVRLVGTNKNNIVDNLVLLTNSVTEYQKMSKSINPYGDGQASGRIVNFIVKNLI